MVREDLTYNKQKKLTISPFFEEEEDILKILKSKYGERVLVEEEFEDDGNRSVEPDLPFNAIEYEEYYDPGDPGSPGSYWDPPDPGEPAEWHIVYETDFDDLIEYLFDVHGLEGEEIELFFKTYAYTPQEREKYYDKARKWNGPPPPGKQWTRGPNAKPKRGSESHTYYSTEYRNIR